MSSRRLFFLVPVFVVFAACGGTGTNTEPVPSGAPPSTELAAPSTSVEPVSMQAVDGVVATANGAVDVYPSIDASTPASTLPPATEFGSPTTLLVTEWQGPAGEWLRVALPVRPNGATGFVHAGDVTIARFAHRIDVDVATKTLRVGDAGGNIVVETPVAIGTPENPTPTGNFYVTDVMDNPNDSGAYGPFAIGLSAHSDTLSEFGGGDGQIGIHGTNQPSSIGTAASHGCVRVPNDVVTQLAGMIALGTPVTIH
jgi:lipoprotein-anchoring transpeptidase ErfK/SrfK